MIQRLFDIVAVRAKEAPESVMLAAKENGDWKTYTTAYAWEMANKLANGLLPLLAGNIAGGPEAQDKIAIISPNRPEWLITDLAAQLTGAILTPVYPTISPSELEYVLNEAEARIVFIANSEIYHRFRHALERVPTVKTVVAFDQLEEIPHWTTILSNNAHVSEEVTSRVTMDTLATIIYTSGTTGNPKGVMLTHKNIVSNVQDCMPVFSFAEAQTKALSFLPLNHIFERMVSYVYLQAGLAIYYAESMDTIGLNLREVKPIVFTTVPRLLEKVYERILNTGLELKGIKRALFFWALNLGKRYDNAGQQSQWYQLQLSLANRLVFSKWREALGGQVRAIVVGSAPTQERLVRIFTAAGLRVMEGYGLTETSPVIAVNRYESAHRRMGTVGPLIQNVEVTLAEDGEILTRGANVTMGYYKHPELTEQAIDSDGWLHTGDIGNWVEGRFLKITDRKKEIFKTSGGKYVAPQVIENKMKESPYIEQMIVLGANRKFVSALIVPSFGHIRKYFRDNYPNVMVPEKNEDAIRMKEVYSLVEKQVEKYNECFSHPEQVKKFVLLPAEWTIDSGELTPSLKIKRKVIETRFAHLIENIYHE